MSLTRTDEEGHMACPLCGWRIVSAESRASQEKKVAEGWWWCADGHVKTPVAWVAVSSTGSQRDA